MGYFMALTSFEYPVLVIFAFKTLLLTITLYGFSIFLVSAMALPLLSNVFLPIWRFLLQKGIEHNW